MTTKPSTERDKTDDSRPSATESEQQTSTERQSQEFLRQKYLEQQARLA